MKIPESLRQTVQAGKAIPFVGAGVSMAVRIKKDGTSSSLFPSWRQLLYEAADRLKRNNKEPDANLVQAFLEFRPPKYLEAAKYAYEAFAPDDWYSFLKSNLDPNFSEALEGLELARAIWALSNGLIITTNYDNTLSWACARSNDVRKWCVESPVQMAEFLQRDLSKPTVWHLHGCIDQPETVILTPDGYSRLYPEARFAEARAEDRFKAAFDTLQSVMREYSLIFIGYSMDDKEVGDQIRLIGETFQGGTGHHYMLVRERDYEDAEQRLSKLGRSIELITFEDFGPPLVKIVEDLAALKEKKGELASEPVSATLAQAEPFSLPQIPPLPVLDKSAFERLFIGRERLLGDIRTALNAIGKGDGGEGNYSWVDHVQLFWIYGHGGMGKSWLLRRAYIEAEQRYPDVRLALIDWDAPQWREPLTQPPIDNEQLFKVIAYRIAQLFGLDALRPYWAASAKVQASKDRYADLQVDFLSTLEHLVTERHSSAQPAGGGHLTLMTAETSEADQKRKYSFHLETVLRAARLWNENPGTLQRLINSLLADPIRKERIFEEWAERVAGRSADRATYQPGRLLADALRNCLRDLTDKSPILLVLDTCELLSPELDWWLRHLLTPLLDGVTPLVVIIGSRQRPDSAVPEGRSEGWIPEIPDRLRRIVQFDEHVRFTVEEIGSALHRLRRLPPDNPTLAELLRRATSGFPLALRALFDLHEDGDNVLSELSTLQEEPGEEDRVLAMERVYEKVSNRFLLHLERENREEELRDVTVLALFRRVRVEILKRFWSCTSIRERLRPLELRYSLVADGDLHEIVRRFLRLHWRNDPPARVLDIASQLTEIVRDLEPATDTEEPDFVEWMIDRCELASWLEGQNAFSLFARTLAVALPFDHDVRAIGMLAREIPVTFGAARKSKHLISSLADYYYSVYAWGTPELLSWLNQQRSSRWTELEQASLSLLNGMNFNMQFHFAEAIQQFQNAFPAFVGKSLPRRQHIAQAYLNSVAKSEQSMVSVAEEAYQWVNRLGLVDQDSWNHDYYWVLHNACRYDEAESYCRRVIKHEPSNLSAYAFLGHILGAHLGQTQKAEEEYRQGLEADDEDPTLHFFLGELLERQGRFDEAEVEYRRALSLVVSSKDKVRVLGRLSRLLANKLGRTEEAIPLFRQAIENNPEEPGELNSLAWNLYIAKVDLDKAEQLAKKAVMDDPDNQHSLQTLAAILVRLDKWNEAKPKVQRWLQMVDAEYLKRSWDEFLLLFADAVKNGHAPELATFLECRGDDEVWPLLRSVLLAIDNNSNIFVDLPAHLQGAAAQVKEQMLSDERILTFPTIPSVND